MTGVEKLVEKAKEYKEKGFKEKEIATELNVSPDTVTWLLTRDMDKEQPPSDVKIGWRSIGVFGGRIGMLANLFSDVIMEETELMGTEFDTVVGIAINGIPPAVLVSEQLRKELAIFRPPQEERHEGGGTLASNYAAVSDKKVVIVDDVINTGETMQGAITDLEDRGAEVVLCTVTVNKDGRDEVLGIPLRGLIRAQIIG
ncbi:MAG: orotate phosphoribosyltransferase-like protein [Candidatus Thermoplasmatota archaeon]|nr:orotate phosphoribosyltransferase-like protein [Candidatus Thermoplasmatota archaeon]